MEIDHPNIVRMINFNLEGLLTDEEGNVLKQVFYIVLELVNNGSI